MNTTKDLRPESWYYNSAFDLPDDDDHPYYADHPRHDDRWWQGTHDDLFLRWGDALTGEMAVLWEELGCVGGDRFDALYAALMEKFEEQCDDEIQCAYIEWCEREREEWV